MFGYITRPFRAIHRVLGRTPIETRERQALSDVRKVLLSYHSATEKSKFNVGMYKERVARLKADLAIELARPKEKSRWDWARMDQNTLVTAIKDDLYEAEKKLHEETADYESNLSNTRMFTDRAVRLEASLEQRKAEAALTKTTDAVTQPSLGVEYDPANGQIDLLSEAGRNPLRVPRSDAAPGKMIGASSKNTAEILTERHSPSEMGGLVSA